ncbi:hypothetical protein NDU88_001347 [Pleurodeles waltl]|uniref:Uncharacterized protein n=1 Tax=Pleurodeles waltl TaxID=8319 RepID=A0AAV7KSF5_PLEWA|nr:hypothetical protein NDU88_001347 [Pleurodeles waltl]
MPVGGLSAPHCFPVACFRANGVADDAGSRAVSKADCHDRAPRSGSFIIVFLSRERSGLPRLRQLSRASQPVECERPPF